MNIEELPVPDDGGGGENYIRLRDLEFNRLLTAWACQGWIRALDRAFVLFLDAEAKAQPLVLLAALFTSWQLVKGHICFDIEMALDQPAALPGPEAGDEDGGLITPAAMVRGIKKEQWRQMLLASPLVSDGEGGAPLVLRDYRLYLRRYWQYEMDVALALKRKMAHVFDFEGNNLILRLDRLFTPLRDSGERAKTHVHWQSVAAALAARSAFTVVSGGPGTGKTTTVVQIIALLAGLASDRGRVLRVALAAPTGKAAARLTESIRQAAARLPEELRAMVPEEVMTLHRLLGRRPGSGRFKHNARCKLHIDLLVVDEASMVDMEMMAAVMAALPEEAGLILLGDKDQLASVEAGSVLGDLCRRAGRPGYKAETAAWLENNTGYSLREAAGEGGEIDQHIVVLRHSHRFGPQSGIGALAAAVNAGDEERLEAVWQDYTDVRRLRLTSPADERLATLILEGYRPGLGLCRQGAEGETDSWCRRLLEAFNRFQLLTPARRGVWGVEGLNHLTARILYQAGLIPAPEGWYVGRPVLVTANDYSLGLMNGDIGLTLPVGGEGSDHGGLRVVFQTAFGELKKISPARLPEVETVYAMTVHKSQGSEFEHTVMALPEYDSPLLTRELIYTGITRAREKFTLIGCRPELLSSAVRRRTRRASGLGTLLK